MLLTVAQVLLFIVMVVLNYLATSESIGAVAFTNAQIADTHPVFGLPNGWAFAIWGIIFLTLGLYTVYQALPTRWYGGLECPLVEKIRAPVLAFELFNSAWNFLFGWEQYWMALLDIVLYDILLWIVILRLDVNYFLPVPGKTRWQSLRTKLLVATPFSVQTAWVTVATALNVQVNLLEEGWLPSPGFSIGCCWLAVTIGVYLAVVRYADLPYTLATIWALGGLVSNQSPDTSTFGCISRICDACNRAALPICTRLNSAASDRPPNGWAALDCAAADYGANVTGWGTAATVARNAVDCVEQVVPKSAAVVWWSVAGMCVVSAAFLVGLGLACHARCGRADDPIAMADEAKMEAGRATADVQPKPTPATTAAMNGAVYNQQM